MRKRRFRLRLNRRVILAVLAICLASVLVQVLYPRSWTMPLTRFEGKTLLFADDDTIRASVAERERQTLHISARDKEYQLNISDLGIVYDLPKLERDITNYGWLQRAIPFSIVVRSLSTRYLPSTASDKLAAYSQKVAAERTIPPTNAQLKADGENIVVEPDKNGIEVSQEKVAKALMGLAQGFDKKRTVKQSVSHADISKDEAEDIAKQAQDQVENGFSLKLGSETFEPTKAELAQWPQVAYDDKRGIAILSTNPEAIAQYVERATRAKTKSLRGVDGAYIAGVVTEKFAKGEKLATVEIVKASSGLAYLKTNEGLRLLLEDIVKDKGDYGIAVRDLSGTGWSASSYGDQKFITASTYKIFVAYSTLKRIEAGTFGWSDPTFGTTLAACFERMIIDSDNACAETLGMRIGWQTVFAEMRALGMSKTNFAGDFYSTADDEALLLTKLGKGELLSEASRRKLFDTMKRQRYREAIPAGTKVPVADKVGFLYGLLHDAGIVYGPKREYVLVILTDGSTWADMADAAKDIHLFMQS